MAEITGREMPPHKGKLIVGSCLPPIRYCSSCNDRLPAHERLLINRIARNQERQLVCSRCQRVVEAEILPNG